jgi:hypothetical protein
LIPSSWGDGFDLVFSFWVFERDWIQGRVQNRFSFWVFFWVGLGFAYMERASERVWDRYLGFTVFLFSGLFALVYGAEGGKGWLRSGIMLDPGWS